MKIFIKKNIFDMITKLNFKNIFSCARHKSNLDMLSIKIKIELLPTLNIFVLLDINVLLCKTLIEP